MSTMAVENIQNLIVSLNNCFYAYLVQTYSDRTWAIERGNIIKTWVQAISQESAWRLSLFKGVDVKPNHSRQEYFKLMCDC